VYTNYFIYVTVFLYFYELKITQQNWNYCEKRKLTRIVILPRSSLCLNVSFS